jgi:hypothetical protein
MWHWIGRLLQRVRRSDLQEAAMIRPLSQRLQVTCIHQILEHEKRGPDDPWRPKACRVMT